VTESGVYWRIASLPEVPYKIPIGSGPGAFSTILSGLSPYTLYCIGTYAISSTGISYGDEIYFRTLQ